MANPSEPMAQSWQTESGTSFAAPQVSGVVALMLEREPRLWLAEVKRRLGLNADPPAEAIPDKQVGYGVVNPWRALTEVAPGGGGGAPLVWS